MSQTNLNVVAPETTPTPKRGFLLPCPCCGEEAAGISLNLGDGETFTCGECETEFTTEHIRDFIAKWTKILAWVDAMPTDGI
jgi:transcription elongation factor Elf1